MSHQEIKKTKATEEKQESEKKNATSSHPSTSQMVLDALNSLEKRRKGQSLHAIKKHIDGKYLINIEKYKRFIKSYLDKAVKNGEIIKIKRSYKLPKDKPKKVGKENKPPSAKKAPKNKKDNNQSSSRLSDVY